MNSNSTFGDDKCLLSVHGSEARELGQKPDSKTMRRKRNIFGNINLDFENKNFKFGILIIHVKICSQFLLLLYLSLSSAFLFAARCFRNRNFSQLDFWSIGKARLSKTSEQRLLFITVSSILGKMLRDKKNFVVHLMLSSFLSFNHSEFLANNSTIKYHRESTTTTKEKRELLFPLQ